MEHEQDVSHSDHKTSLNKFHNVGIMYIVAFNHEMKVGI